MIRTTAHNDDEVEEPEEIGDDEATLADDLLDEVAGDDTEDDALEGFGILPIKEDADEEEDEEEGDAELEDDAEDVEFDAFDDIDEM